MTSRPVNERARSQTKVAAVAWILISHAGRGSVWRLELAFAFADGWTMSIDYSTLEESLVMV
jgi:hypothetical protein